LPNGLKIILFVIASGILPITAQTQGDPDFASLIRTAGGVQSALERCDGHPDFETALANWLEVAEPSSPADRRAVREISLRLLADVTDRQVALALSDGLLRHALEDVKRDESVVPQKLAEALYADFWRAVRNQRSKATAIPIQALELEAGGSVKDQRQASFLGAFLKLVDARVAGVSPASIGSKREQSDQRPR
jgi:hypothetical protein